MELSFRTFVSVSTLTHVVPEEKPSSFFMNWQIELREHICLDLFISRAQQLFSDSLGWEKAHPADKAHSMWRRQN